MMRALIAQGASDREASRVGGEELRIPESTLRKHLKREPGPLEFDTSRLDILTEAESEEIQRRSREREAARAASPPKLGPRVEAQRRELEAFRHRLVFPLTPHGVPPKKKR